MPPPRPDTGQWHLPLRHRRFELGDLRGLRRLAVEVSTLPFRPIATRSPVLDVAGEIIFRQRVCTLRWITRFSGLAP